MSLLSTRMKWKAKGRHRKQNSMYIVTGVSRGLGKGIVEELLKGKQKVIGIGRSNPFGDSISFKTCDLSDPQAIENLEFSSFSKPVTLINNAGVIGSIGRISEQPKSDLGEVLQVNVLAPMALTRKIYAAMQNPQDFTLVNISSGAANRSIPSWASYCASKAALNRLTENFYLEEKELGHDLKVYAVAPGVIDTDMQTEIRSAAPEDFSGRDNFVRMKTEGQLYSPEDAAKRLIMLLNQPFSGDVFQDLRSLNP